MDLVWMLNLDCCGQVGLALHISHHEPENANNVGIIIRYGVFQTLCATFRLHLRRAFLSLA